MMVLAAILTCLCPFALAQTAGSFTVIKVNGNVYSNALKRVVKTGDIIQPSDRLQFNSRESYLHVINDKEGLKTVRSVPDNSPRELMQLLQKFLANQKSNRAMRGGTAGWGKMREQLNHDTLLILGPGRLSILGVDKPLSPPRGIKASYTINGKKVDKLISEGTQISLAKENLFDNNVATEYPSVQVIYYEDVADAFFSPIEMLGSFVPLYVDNQSVKQELRVIVDALRSAGVAEESLMKEVIYYLRNEYATPIEANVEDFLKSMN